MLSGNLAHDVTKKEQCISKSRWPDAPDPSEKIRAVKISKEKIEVGMPLEIPVQFCVLEAFYLFQIDPEQSH